MFPRTLSGICVACIAGSALASSHSDAPLIKQDPQANLTDVYAFVGTRYDKPGQRVLNIIAHVRPFSEPGDGPHYERFADDARYSLHVTDPATGQSILRYDFLFSAPDGAVKNPNTILSFGLGTTAGPIMTIGDATQNFTQTYSVTQVAIDGPTGTEADTSRVIGGDLVVAPPNPGGNTTPLYNDARGRAVSGAEDLASLDSYTSQAIHDLDGGVVAFAGPRDDSFYADIPGVFDLLDARILENDGNGVDGFKGFNVLAYAVQIPIENLPAMPYDSVFFGPQRGVGVYASVSRPKLRSFDSTGRRRTAGPWVQVNRIGNPLFNEGLVALADKDRYNRTSPTGDDDFAIYAEQPELASLINFVFPESNLVDTGRNDLVGIFIPDVLRVNTTTEPVRLSGQENFSRLGFLGGDTVDGGVSGAWPNGRRLGDDVVDIALTAIASGPTYAEITPLGDNVDANDILFNQVFPYSATPHAGTFNRKDPVPSAAAAADLNGDGVVNGLDLLIILRNLGSRAD